MAKVSELHVKILQNGHPVAECVRSVSRSLMVELTSDYKGDLSLPLYPLPGDMKLFSMVRGQLTLYLDQPWTGFMVTAGEMKSIVSSDRGDRMVTVSQGDFGSLCLKDLRLLYRVKVSSKGAGRDFIRAKGYSASPFSLALSDRFDLRAGLVAIFSALAMVFTMSYYMLHAKVTRPSSLQDLGPEYVLPFVGPDHLRLAPEALQTRLDRTNYLRSTIAYYRAISSTISGWFDGSSDKYLKKPVVTRFAGIHADFAKTVADASRAQQALDLRVVNERGAGLVVLPSVKGESVGQRLMRITDKIAIAQEGFRRTLKARRILSKKFGLDEQYDWLNYHSGPPKSRTAQEYLAKIRVFSDLSNEQYMYAASERLASEAESIQKSKFGKSAGHSDRNSSGQFFVQIDPGVSFSSFLASASLIANDEKFGQIHASSFDKQRKEVIREPLIGEIDPSVIQKTLAKNQFQLQLCYELALRRNQATSGFMDWKWRIDSRGKILDIELRQSTIKDRRMVDCVRNKMAVWQFPKPRKGSIEVNHSFHFSPQKG